MYERFESLDGEKQQRIANAAMKEFAANGYDKASTNRIVEDAGIAKGLLFHYFGSKKALFLYLYDRALTLVFDKVSDSIDFAEKDFFVRVQKAQRAKLELIGQYPDIMNFLKNGYLEESPSVKQEMDQRNCGAIASGFQLAFKDIDTSVFRPDMDLRWILKTIAWSYEGFSNEFMQTIKQADAAAVDYEPLLAESDRYAEFLKKCFYKSNHQGGGV